jgi:tetratricopeptide (TPR) repeat protein
MTIKEKRKMRKTSGIDGAALRLGILPGLLALTGFLYAVFYLGVPFWGERDFAVRFQKALREYDALFEASMETSEAPSTSTAAARLRYDGRLEKKLAAIERLNGNARFATLQTTLSLLKRWRVFARYDRNFRARYEENLRAAEKKYPATVQLRALSMEAALKIKNGLPTITDALNIGPSAGTFLAALTEFSGNTGKEREYLLVDTALLSIAGSAGGGEYRDTNAVLYPLDLREAESVNTFRFAAEYAYDAGDFSLSSRLFAALPDENALSRAGDALFLGGDTDGARELWRLSTGANSLYNYASLTEETAERITALEELLAEYADPTAPSFTAALILYTRLLSDERAAAVLGTSPYTAQNPLLDVELWRHTEKNYPPDRALAEMWLLVGRHIKEPAVYEYASWYFGRERQYEELALLLKNAALQGAAGSRMPRYWQIMLDARTRAPGTVRESLAAFRDESGEQPWFLSANIGRLYEAERSWKNAVDHYRIALANAPKNTDKSRLLQRMSVCLAAQGRNSEAFAALEEAVSLDPANLTARSALSGGLTTGLTTAVRE